MSIRETHKTTITLDVQQLFEVSKAITDRIAKYALSTDEEYPYREQDIAVLQAVQEVLSRNIDFVTETYEGEIAVSESAILNDEEAVRRFIEGDE